MYKYTIVCNANVVASRIEKMSKRIFFNQNSIIVCFVLSCTSCHTSCNFDLIKINDVAVRANTPI